MLAKDSSVKLTASARANPLRANQRRQHPRHARALRRIEREGQGIWSLKIIFPEDARALLIEARAGGTAAALFVLLARTIGTIERASPPSLCLLCEHEFAHDSPAALAIVSALVDAPTQSIGTGLCADCVEPAETLLERVTQTYRQQIRPGLRVLPMPSSPGSA